MVPLRDENPITITPYVTYGLVILNVLIFLIEISLSPSHLQRFFDSWAIVPHQLTASFVGQVVQPDREWITLITSQFLHGGFLHILGNMLYLWVFGNNIEDQLGHSRFLIFYLGCGVIAGLAQWVFNPFSTIPTLGASGAIAGVMGAYILRFPRARILTLVPLFIFVTVLRIPAIVFLGLWFIQQAFYSFLSLGADANMGSSGIAYWAHAGGFVFGMILGPLLGLMSPKNNTLP